MTKDSSLIRFLRPRLFQASATETFQVALSVRVLLDRYLVHDPSKRNIGLSAAKLLECGYGDFDLTGHAGGSGEDTVGAGVISAQADSDARQLYRLIVIVPDELGQGGRAITKRRERIARA
jgi:hypothetical protein